MADDRTLATRAFHTRIAAAQDLLHQIAMRTPIGAAFADPVDVRVQLLLVGHHIDCALWELAKVEKPAARGSLWHLVGYEWVTAGSGSAITCDIFATPEALSSAASDSRPKRQPRGALRIARGALDRLGYSERPLLRALRSPAPFLNAGFAFHGAGCPARHAGSLPGSAGKSMSSTIAIVEAACGSFGRLVPSVPTR